MRTISLNGILTALGLNSSYRNKDVCLYETGNVYLPKALPLTELPDERMKLTLGAYGDQNAVDFFSMKGVVELLFKRLGMLKRASYEVRKLKPYLHPGRQADIYYEGRFIGFLGEVHPTVRKTYGIRERAYVAVIDMPSLEDLATFDRKYTGIARYPAMTRDISLLVPHDVTNAQIEDIIYQRGGKLLEACTLFDVYEGPPVQSGFKSMAYSLIFRHREKTLEENEVTAAMKKILNGLDGLGITMRS